MTGPGWTYVLTYPAWDKPGTVKVGRTGSDRRTHPAEPTSASFRVAAATVREVVEAVAGSLSLSIVAVGLAAVISWFTLVQPLLS